MTAHRLREFVLRCSSGAYIEEKSDLHVDIARQVWEKCKGHFTLPLGARVLDIGTGSGYALRMFSEEGLNPIGISCLPDEVDRINDGKGWGPAIECDMHDIHTGVPGTFDFCWVRHCLEHSPCPGFVLGEIHSILNPTGYLYVECPMPDTSCGHTVNPNHWTVLTKSGWQQLILRSGFTILENLSITFATQLGDDEYAGFICQKNG